MYLNEFLPIVIGLFLGAMLYFVPKSYRFAASLFLIPLFGFFAVYASGEYQISWMFLLIDIPMVAFSAVAGFAAMHFLPSLLKKPV